MLMYSHFFFQSNLRLDGHDKSKPIYFFQAECIKGDFFPEGICGSFGVYARLDMKEKKQNQTQKNKECGRQKRVTQRRGEKNNVKAEYNVYNLTPRFSKLRYAKTKIDAECNPFHPAIYLMLE